MRFALRTEAQGKKSRIGVLVHTTPEGTKHLMAAFVARMADFGWVEGRNIEYLLRYAGADPGRHAALVSETIAQTPDVIFAPFGPFALAAATQTSDLPIVFCVVDDPVKMGLVDSIAHPGRNATGATTRSRELIGKQLQLLKETVPTLRRVGVTGTVTTAEHAATVEEIKRKATELGLRVAVVQHELEQGGNYAPAIASLIKERVEAFLGITYLIYPLHRQFVEHVGQTGLPAIYDNEEFVRVGGLMSYSVSLVERYREAANYVDRILRGARPKDLPVEEPRQFSLTLNRRTAAALGLRIPSSVLVQADRVIE